MPSPRPWTAARIAQPSPSTTAVKQHARRPRGPAAAAPKTRSTPRVACFMTSPEPTVTSVAHDVALYVALPIAPSIPAPLPPVPSSARHRSRAGPFLSPPPPRPEVPVRVQKQLENLPDRGPRLDRLASGPRAQPRTSCEPGRSRAEEPKFPRRTQHRADLGRSLDRIALAAALLPAEPEIGIGSNYEAWLGSVRTPGVG